MKEQESDIRATGSIRPIRLVRDAEVLRIPRPNDLIDVDATDESQELPTAQALI